MTRSFPLVARPTWRRSKAFLARWGGPLWLALLLALATVFVLRQRDQLAAVGGLLRDADRRWVLVALGVEVVALGLIALTYRALLARLGHGLHWRSLAGLHVRRVLVGTVSPVGGPPSLYVLVRDLGRRGVPADDALLAAGLRSALNYAAFLALLLPALALHHPSRAVLVAAAALVAIFAGVAAALAVLLRAGAGTPRWADRLPRRAREFVARARGHGVRAGDLLGPFGFALGTRLAGAALLFACLRAVGERPSPFTAVVAYAVGVLCITAAPVFGGIGVVEVSVAAALGHLGVPAGPAIGAALLCRVGELWLPVALGLVAQIGVTTSLAESRHAAPPCPAAARPRPHPWRRGGTGWVPVGLPGGALAFQPAPVAVWAEPPPPRVPHSG